MANVLMKEGRGKMEKLVEYVSKEKGGKEKGKVVSLMSFILRFGGVGRGFERRRAQNR